jgi:hypothetical protein
MDRHKWADAIIAFINGIAVQTRCTRESSSFKNWGDLSPMSNLALFDEPDYEFRIKPAPRKARRIWVLFGTGMSSIGRIEHEPFDDATEFVEVLPDE